MTDARADCHRVKPRQSEPSRLTRSAFAELALLGYKRAVLFTCRLAPVSFTPQTLAASVLYGFSQVFNLGG